MNAELVRKHYLSDTTVGELRLAGDFFCHTLEDVVREVPGQPVEAWKVKGATAIPEGTYELVLATSPRFGPETLTLLNVPGFAGIRIHSGMDHEDTEGCILVGDVIDLERHTIAGGKVRGVLAGLKATVKASIEAGERVWLTVRGAWRVTQGKA